MRVKDVLRLRSYYSEFNPIEFAWALATKYAKMNNNKFQLADVHKLLRDGIDLCTAEKWKNFIRHVQKEEERFWEIDFVVDDGLENIRSTVVTITRESADSQIQGPILNENVLLSSSL